MMKIVAINKTTPSHNSDSIQGRWNVIVENHKLIGEYIYGFEEFETKLYHIRALSEINRVTVEIIQDMKKRGQS